MRRSCSSNRRSASISSTTTSAKRMALIVSATGELLEFPLDARRPPQPSGVVQVEGPALPVQIDLDGVARDPASGPVSMRSLAEQRFTSVDLPELGRPTMATRIVRTASLKSFGASPPVFR